MWKQKEKEYTELLNLSSFETTSQAYLWIFPKNITSCERRKSCEGLRRNIRHKDKGEKSWGGMEARGFCGFHDRVVTSTALWPSGLGFKGPRAALFRPVCPSCSRSLVTERHLWCQWADSSGSYQGSLTEQGESSERQKDAQRQLLSSCKSFVWLKGLLWFSAACHQMPRCSSNSAQSRLGERMAAAGKDSWKSSLIGVASVISWTYQGLMYILSRTKADRVSWTVF